MIIIISIYLLWLVMYLKENGNRPGGFFWTVHLILGLSIVIGVIGTAINNNKSKTESSPADYASANPTPNTDVPINQPQNTSTSPWTMQSDGHTWNAASDDEKHQLCAAIARNDNKGNSESFYYDAFNSFYDSNDSKILNTSINGMIPLIDSGSTTLPPSEKNY